MRRQVVLQAAHVAWQAIVCRLAQFGDLCLVPIAWLYNASRLKPDQVIEMLAVDEIAYYSATVGDKKTQDQFAALLRDLVGAVDDLDRPDPDPGSVPVPASVAGRQVDPLRVASWRLESGEPGDPDQRLLLAREALGRLDHHLAERLALAAGGTSRAEDGLVVAEALSLGDATVLLIGSQLGSAAAELAGVASGVQLAEVGDFAPARWAASPHPPCCWRGPRARRC